MRATAGPLHKALVPVLGVPMIERNLCRLLSEGFDRIVVAVGQAESSIADYIDGRGRALTDARGGHIEILWERQPLGTIGAAREAIGNADSLLIVNVDNLTSLELRALVTFHRQRGAALTVASHRELFPIPFGELKLQDVRVRRYIEKPVKSIRISSGTYVLDREACLAIPHGRRVDAPELVCALLNAGKLVAAFRHAAAWIDVNNSASIERAEELIASRCREFEWWRQPFDWQIARLLLRSPAGIVLEHRARTNSDGMERWDLPGELLRPQDREPADALTRTMHRRAQSSDFDFLTSFDDLDPSSGRLIRHHIYLAELGDDWRDLRLDEDWQWHPIEAIHGLVRMSPVLSRAVAALARHKCTNVPAFCR